MLRHFNQNPNQFNSIIRPARPVSEVLTQAIHQARPGNIITAGSTGMELGFYLTTGYGIAINGYNSAPSGPGGEPGRQSGGVSHGWLSTVMLATLLSYYPVLQLITISDQQLITGDIIQHL